MSRIKINKYK